MHLDARNICNGGGKGIGGVGNS